MRPKRTSVAIVRSWASSSINTEYFEQSGSTSSSRKSIPSVYHQIGWATLTHHVFDLCLWTSKVFEPNGVADLRTKPTAHLLGDTLSDGHGGHLSRLSTAKTAPHKETFLGDVLRHLRGLARAGIAYNNKDLVLK